MLRQIVYQDSIIAKSRELVTSLRDEGLLDDVVTTAIYDILTGIGVPNGGIHLAIGDSLYCIDDRPFDPAKCSICVEPATLVAVLKDGSHALVCERHGQIARASGLAVS